MTALVVKMASLSAEQRVGVSFASVLFNVIVSCEGRQLQSLNVSNTSSRNCVRGLV